MRLWTIHPKYLDRQGLVALWREGLLAQEVLRGNTKGYKNHPQLERFKNHPDQLQAIAYFLYEVLIEAQRRNYHFDESKISLVNFPKKIKTTTGQLIFEFNHLLKKIERRSRQQYDCIVGLKIIDPHPLFQIITGDIEEWEKGNNTGIIP